MGLKDTILNYIQKDKKVDRESLLDISQRARDYEEFKRQRQMELEESRHLEQQAMQEEQERQAKYSIREPMPNNTPPEERNRLFGMRKEEHTVE